jgi:hypothetical protein
MMACFTGAQAPTLAAAWPLAPVEVIADLGGGTGTLLATLVAAGHARRGFVVERPDTVTGAHPPFAAHGVADRCELLPGDMFAPQAHQANVWVLKQVLHDWDDDTCVTILGHVRAALRPGDQIVIIELVADPTRPGSDALLDAQMMVVTPGGKERTAPQWRTLLARAGLALTADHSTVVDLHLLVATPAR